MRGSFELRCRPLSKRQRVRQWGQVLALALSGLGVAAALDGATATTGGPVLEPLARAWLLLPGDRDGFVWLSPTPRAEPTGPAVAAGTEVEILRLREILGPESDRDRRLDRYWNESFVYVRAPDGQTGWVSSGKLWPVARNWPALLSLVKSEACRESEQTCTRVVVETLLGGPPPGWSLDDGKVALAQALRRRSAQRILPDGRVSEVRLSGIFNTGPCGPYFGVIYAPESTPREPALILLAEEKLGTSEAVAPELAADTRVAPVPPLAEAERWYRERIEAEGPSTESVRARGCRWHAPVDVYQDGTVDLIGACEYESPSGENLGLFWLERRETGWEPHLARVTFGSRDRPLWVFPEPLDLVVSDINDDGLAELWFRAWHQDDVPTEAWLVFFDLGSQVLGPIVLSVDWSDC